MIFLKRLTSRVSWDLSTNCLNYHGAKRLGYAWVSYRKKQMSGSRAVLIELTDLHFGNKLMFACHKCNNRACINPEHLYWGTRKDNVQDMLKAGNHNWQNQKYIGEKNPRSKLTNEIVILILKLKQKGFGGTKISNKLNLNINTVNNVFYGKRWKHVTI